MGELVSIKGTRQGLVIMVDANADYEQVKDYLHKKMQSAKGFFRGARFSLVPGENVSESQKAELQQICSQYGLIHDEKVKLPSFEQSSPKTNENRINYDKETFTKRPGEKTLLVRRTLRSGQSIQYDGNVVILGDVNAGSEVIAGGSIMVLGRINGVVHAGATGDTSAYVVACKLCPSQLRIASAIATSPDDEPEYPEIARLKDNQIIVSRYKP